MIARSHDEELSKSHKITQKDEDDKVEMRLMTVTGEATYTHGCLNDSRI
jgi:hypothetical protein